MLKNNKNQKKNNASLWLKYSGLGFQLAALIMIAWFLGKYLDRLVGFSKPAITLLLILVFFGAFMYRLYIDLKNPKSG